MSSVLAQSSAEVIETALRSLPAGRQLVLTDLEWTEYDHCLELRDRLRPRAQLTYNRGRLALRTKSLVHERYAYTLGRFISYLAEELNVPILGCRETTIRREDLDQGFEPDEWFHVGPTATRMIGTAMKRDLDFRADPPPDLAIEVEISRNLLDRIDLYAALGVVEIWRYDGTTLTAWLLGPDRTYSPIVASRAFPTIPLIELVRFLSLAGTMDDAALARQFRAWARSLASSEASK